MQSFIWLSVSGQQTLVLTYRAHLCVLSITFLLTHFSQFAVTSTAKPFIDRRITGQHNFWTVGESCQLSQDGGRSWLGSFKIRDKGRVMEKLSYFFIDTCIGLSNLHAKFGHRSAGNVGVWWQTERDRDRNSYRRTEKYMDKHKLSQFTQYAVCEKPRNIDYTLLLRVENSE